MFLIVDDVAIKTEKISQQNGLSNYYCSIKAKEHIQFNREENIHAQKLSNRIDCPG